MKGSARDGCYTSKLVALSYKASGKLLPMWSVGAAKEFLGVKHVAVFNETVAQEDPTAVASKFFTLVGGSKDGVYEGLQKLLAAKKSGGGIHNVYVSRESAQKAFDAASAGASEQFYVVWEGTTTGVLSEEQMVEATCGVASVIEGPMSKHDADLIWSGKADEVSVAKSASSGSSKTVGKASLPKSPSIPGKAAAATPTKSSLDNITLQSPSDDDIEKAWMAGKKRVFSCWVSPTVGRVALSWEAAAKGIVDPEVKVTSSESSLFLNIAKAEKVLKQARKPSPVKSIADRMAEARKAILGDVVDSGDKGAAAPAAAAASSGTSSSARFSMSGVVRTKEAIKITK